MKVWNARLTIQHVTKAQVFKEHQDQVKIVLNFLILSECIVTRQKNVLLYREVPWYCIVRK